MCIVFIANFCWELTIIDMVIKWRAFCFFTRFFQSFLVGTCFLHVFLWRIQQFPEAQTNFGHWKCSRSEEEYPEFHGNWFPVLEVSNILENWWLLDANSNWYIIFGKSLKSIVPPFRVCLLVTNVPCYHGNAFSQRLNRNMKLNQAKYFWVSYHLRLERVWIAQRLRCIYCTILTVVVSHLLKWTL